MPEETAVINNIKQNEIKINSNFTQHNFFIQGKKVRAFFPKSKTGDEKIISRVQDILISNYINGDRTLNNTKK